MKVIASVSTRLSSQIRRKPVRTGTTLVYSLPEVIYGWKISFLAKPSEKKYAIAAVKMAALL